MYRKKVYTAKTFCTKIYSSTNQFMEHNQSSTKSLIFQQMPLSHLLSWLGNHVIPMTCLHWATPASKYHSTNQFVSPNFVKVHDADLHVGFSDFLPRNIKNEWLVVDWVESSHLDVGLLLLNSCCSIGEPDFHIRIWKKMHKTKFQTATANSSFYVSGSLNLRKHLNSFNPKWHW